MKRLPTGILFLAFTLLVQSQESQMDTFIMDLMSKMSVYIGPNSRELKSALIRWER